MTIEQLKSEIHKCQCEINTISASIERKQKTLNNEKEIADQQIDNLCNKRDALQSLVQNIEKTLTKYELM